MNAASFRPRRLLAAALLALAALPMTCGAVALPGQDPSKEFFEQGGTNKVQNFDLPGEKIAVGSNKDAALTPLNNAIKRGLQVVAGLSVIMLVWAGITYLTSFGEEEKVKKAKRTILWTILGLFTGLGGWAVIDLVNSVKLN